MNDTHNGPTAGWAPAGEGNGVVLRTRGDGRPLYVLSGLEGSGESCLHLVVPAVDARAGTSPYPPVRVVLVDYAAEQHETFDQLVDTIAELVSNHQGTSPECDVWCQSFGTLLGASMIGRTGLAVERLVLVSAFRTLPAWKVWLGPPALRLAPEPLYRRTATPVSRWQFGPDGGNTGHVFYDALSRLTKDDLARRTAWLRGRSFEPEFRALRPGRGRVWLGSADRLERVGEEMAFFGTLAGRGGPSLGVLDGAGHVVLPPAVIADTRRQIGDWFWKEG